MVNPTKLRQKNGNLNLDDYLCTDLKNVITALIITRILDMNHPNPSNTGRSNWILNRKWKYSMYCLRDVILKIVSEISNSI